MSHSSKKRPSRRRGESKRRTSPASLGRGFEAALSDRILVLEGDIATLVRRTVDGEAPFRDHPLLGDIPHDLAGNDPVLNLSRPEAVASAHLEQALAGADILLTNTRGCDPLSQGWWGVPEAVAADIVRAGVRAARGAAREAVSQLQGDEIEREVFVAGQIGPLGPRPGHAFDDIVSNYRAAVRAFVQEGVDALLLEGCSDARVAKAALRAVALEGGGLPVILSVELMAAPEPTTPCGLDFGAFLRSVATPDVKAVGIEGPLDAKEIYQACTKVSPVVGAYPLLVRPSGIIGHDLGVYDERPNLVGVYGERLADRGVISMLGGGPRTTAEHTCAARTSTLRYKPRKPGRTAWPQSGTVLCGESSLLIDDMDPGDTFPAGRWAPFALAAGQGAALPPDIAEPRTPVLTHIDLDKAESPVQAVLDVRDHARRTFVLSGGNPDALADALGAVQGRSLVLWKGANTRGRRTDFIQFATRVRSLGGVPVLTRTAFETCFQRKGLDLPTVLPTLAKAGLSDIPFGLCWTPKVGWKGFLDQVRSLRKAVPGKTIVADLSACKVSRGEAFTPYMLRLYALMCRDAGCQLCLLDPDLAAPLSPEPVPAYAAEALRRAVQVDGKVSVMLLRLLLPQAEDKGGSLDGTDTIDSIDNTGGTDRTAAEGDSAGKGGALPDDYPDRIHRDFRYAHLPSLRSDLDYALRTGAGPAEIFWTMVLPTLRAKGELMSRHAVTSGDLEGLRQCLEHLLSRLGEVQKAPKVRGRRQTVLVASPWEDRLGVVAASCATLLRIEGVDVRLMENFTGVDAMLDEAAAAGAGAIVLTSYGGYGPALMEETASRMAARGMGAELFLGGDTTWFEHCAVRVFPHNDRVHYSPDPLGVDTQVLRWLESPEEFRREELRILRNEQVDHENRRNGMTTPPTVEEWERTQAQKTETKQNERSARQAGDLAQSQAQRGFQPNTYIPLPFGFRDDDGKGVHGTGTFSFDIQKLCASLSWEEYYRAWGQEWDGGKLTRSLRELHHKALAVAKGHQDASDLQIRCTVRILRGCDEEGVVKLYDFSSDTLAGSVPTLRQEAADPLSAGQKHMWAMSDFVPGGQAGALGPFGVFGITVSLGGKALEAFPSADPADGSVPEQERIDAVLLPLMARCALSYLPREIVRAATQTKGGYRCGTVVPGESPLCPDPTLAVDAAELLGSHEPTLIQGFVCMHPNFQAAPVRSVGPEQLEWYCARRGVRADAARRALAGLAASPAGEAQAH